MAKKTFGLRELADIDIDCWVEGISHLSDVPGVMREAYAMKGWKHPKNEEDLECPAELETELTCIANRDNFRFDSKGNIVSYDRSKRFEK